MTEPDHTQVDLGPLFTTPRIHTDEHGVHTDDAGREHVLVDLDGETEYMPAPSPVLEDQVDEVDVTARVLIDVQVELVRAALEAAFDLGLYVRAIEVDSRPAQVQVFLYRAPACRHPEDLATRGQGISWLTTLGITGGPEACPLAKEDSTARLVRGDIDTVAGVFSARAFVRRDEA